MKKSDIAMIIFIAAISVMIAYFVVKSLPLLAAPSKPVQVNRIEAYSADAGEPDPAVFNSDAVNPTVNVTIGGSPDGQ